MRINTLLEVKTENKSNGLKKQKRKHTNKKKKQKFSTYLRKSKKGSIMRYENQVLQGKQRKKMELTPHLMKVRKQRKNAKAEKLNAVTEENTTQKCKNARYQKAEKQKAQKT